MDKIVVIRISPLRDRITVGFFAEEGSESRLTLTLNAKLFPDGVKVGDSLILTKPANVLTLTGN